MGGYDVKKGDLFWTAVLILILAFLLAPATNALFIAVTNSHPYLLGFLKFSILASMGELLALRIVAGRWIKPAGFLPRAAVWGVIGVLAVLMFDIFSAGVGAAVGKGLLPGKGSKLAVAFFTSATMNLFYSPTFMSAHRISDTYFDMKFAEHIAHPKLSAVVNRVNWDNFVTFVVLKTIPLIWIPAHTVVFLLPPVYRVLMAALLSILLGGILAFAKKRSLSRA